MEHIGLTRTVANHLTEKIVTGEIKPGQHLNELQLTSELKISRSPLREAFRILENTSLVKNVPRKGTFATQISKKDLGEIYDARAMIECFAIELLQRKNEKKTDRLESSIVMEEQFPVPQTDDRKKMLDLWRVHSGFHVELVLACDNSIVNRFYTMISDKLSRYQIIYLRAQGTDMASIRDHRKVLSAIKTGDFEQARELLREHLSYTYQKILSEIDKFG